MIRAIEPPKPVRILKDTASLLRRRAELLGTHHFVEERDMGWLFKSGCSRRDLIAERTEGLGADDPRGHASSRRHALPIATGRRLLRRALDRLGTDLHEGRRRSPADRTLDRLRSAAKSKGFRLGLQGHGRVDGAVLLFVSAEVPRPRAHREVRRATLNGVRRFGGITKGRPRNGGVGSQSKGHRTETP